MEKKPRDCKIRVPEKYIYKILTGIILGSYYNNWINAYLIKILTDVKLKEKFYVLSTE